MYSGGAITEVVASKSNDAGVGVLRKGNVVMVYHKAYETTQEIVDDFSYVVTSLEYTNGHLTKIIYADIDKKIKEAISKVRLVDTYHPEHERLEISLVTD